MQTQNTELLKLTDIDEFLSLIESGNCPKGILVDLSKSVFHGSTYALKISQALSSGQCPKGLQINLNDCNFGAAGMIFIMKALKSGNCPQDLKIEIANNLADHDTSGNSMKNFVEVLNSDQCPHGLQIDVSGNFRAVTVSNISKAMLTNTAVIELKVQESDHCQDDLAFIKHCCIRNTLLQKYPDFEFFIKNVSHKAGLYTSKPKITKPLSLTIHVASFIVSNKQINKDRLPVELKEYLGNLDAISQLLQSAIPPQHK